MRGAARPLACDCPRFVSPLTVRAASDGTAVDQPEPAVARPLFAQSPQYPLLPRALEIELALSAAPKHLRDGATVWVLEQERIHNRRRKGATPSRAWSAAAPAMCSRCAGTRKGPGRCCRSTFEDAQLRLSGKSGAEIDEMVIERFKSGQYRPRRRGPASPTCCRRCASGSTKHGRCHAHPIEPAPDVLRPEPDRQRHRRRARIAFVFINRVGPDGMMIVPVGEKEREAIVSESQSLVEQVERAIGYQPSR